MASAGRDLNTRMSAEDYRLRYNIAFKYFKEHKVEISDAIKTEFPFLEILRDRGFITNEKYKESKALLDNLAPVQRVVYAVLSELEEKFDLLFLQMLFSKVIMRSYPALEDILKGFRDAILKEIWYQEYGGEKSAKNYNTQLSFEQGPGANSCPPLSWLFPDPSNDTDPVDIMKEKLFFNSGGKWEVQARTDCSQASDLLAISSEAYTEFDDGKQPCLPQASTSALTGEPESVGLRKSPASGNKLCKRGPVDLGKTPTGQKAKRKRRSQVKCVNTEDGNWCAPMESEVTGDYETSRNQKGETLPIKPRKTDRKKKLEKPDVCEICQSGEDLFCCDTCSRFFHGNCHLPPVETERLLGGRWSCTFCRIKQSPRSQPVHDSPEVLVRLMGSEEQLKCEFLFLEIYCHSDINYLEIIQQDNHSLESFQCMDTFMILNKIKKKLSERRYPNVGGFIRDMRLIFQNHRAFNKDHALYLMGTNLETIFEHNFKEVFAIMK